MEQQLLDIRATLRELEDRLWKGTNGSPSVVTRVDRIERYQKAQTAMLAGVIALLAPQAMWLLWHGFRAVLNAH